MKVKANHQVLPAFLFLAIFLSGFLFTPPAQADFIRVRGTVVNVRQGPGTSFPVLFQAKQGEEYPLKKSEGLWCLVDLGGGKEAWVFAKLIDVLPGEVAGSPAAAPAAQTDEPERSILQKAARPVFYLVLLLLFYLLFRNRRRILEKTRGKLMEASGYRREKPFRYDDRLPRDDRWEL